MFDQPIKATLWVRYLGSDVIHRAEVFPIPTDQVPVKVKALLKRGDVAEIWYTPGFEWKRDARREYPEET